MAADIRNRHRYCKRPPDLLAPGKATGRGEIASTIGRMALPREPRHVSKFNGLEKGLGQKDLIEFQSVSGASPNDIWPPEIGAVDVALRQPKSDRQWLTAIVVEKLCRHRCGFRRKYGKQCAYVPARTTEHHLARYAPRKVRPVGRPRPGSGRNWRGRRHRQSPLVIDRGSTGNKLKPQSSPPVASLRG
jgi:hypothetical protein